MEKTIVELKAELEKNIAEKQVLIDCRKGLNGLNDNGFALNFNLECICVKITQITVLSAKILRHGEREYLEHRLTPAEIRCAEIVAELD